MAKIVGVVDMRFVVMVGLDDPETLRQVANQLKVAIETQYLIEARGGHISENEQE